MVRYSAEGVVKLLVEVITMTASVIRARDERRKIYNKVGDRRKLKIRDLGIGKDISLDDDVGKERYWDRGDRYAQKREYRVRDEGMERDDDDAGKERYSDRGDSFHDLKHDGGMAEKEIIEGNRYRVGHGRIRAR
ncbi:hypothetical protein Tco_0573376 [Tanacetum coccineum]